MRSTAPHWLPASQLRHVDGNGAIRLRALKKARLITVYVPEARGGVPGFRVERLYGMSTSSQARSSSKDLGLVEKAYGQAVSLLAGQHLSKPAASQLHEEAMRTMESAADAHDPLIVGRSGIEAAASGRGDRWTMYQQPEQYASRHAVSQRPPEQSVRITRSRDGYAVVRLSSFTEGIAGTIGKQLTESRPRGVVLDLRGNGGGMVKEARQLLELFAADNKVMLIERTRNGGNESVSEWRAAKPGPLAGMPLVVLVDGKTASASEIVTASLKDKGYARVAGSRTFGKGVQQSVNRLEDGSGLRVTMGRLEGPRTRWHERGIDVDIGEGDLVRRLDRAGRQEPSDASDDAVIVGALATLRGGLD